MRKRVTKIILLILFCTSLAAQDNHFSQYYASPLSLNPATTGHFEGDWRAIQSMGFSPCHGRRNCPFIDSILKACLPGRW